MQLFSIRAGRESLARPTIAAITTLNSAYTYSFLEIHRIFQEWKKKSSKYVMSMNSGVV